MIFNSLKRTFAAARLVFGLAIALACVAGPSLTQTIVRDADERARTAFQAKVNLTYPNATSASIAIPAGKRLVVEYVSMNFFASSSTANGVQPVVLVAPSLTGGNGFSYYFAPQQSTQATTQFYKSEQVRLYGDTLNIGLGYAGSSPYSMTGSVMVSGYLVSMP